MSFLRKPEEKNMKKIDAEDFFRYFSELFRKVKDQKNKENLDLNHNQEKSNM